jgi:2-oxo-4-hydroxy-4-carboxy-5-ureidoimidazoline decarboxylase
MTLAELNALNREAFTAALGGIYEHSPWVAEAAYALKPFESRAQLHARMQAVVDAASFAQQLALLRAHPELASKAAVRQELSEASNAEQAGAGLTQCSPDEFVKLTALNASYRARFGWPFIIAVKGRTRGSIITAMSARVQHDAAREFAECIAQVGKIAGLRLEALISDEDMNKDV